MNRAWEDAVRILTIFRPGVKVRCGSVLSLYVQVLLVLVQLLSCVWLSLTISRSFPKFMSIESVMPSKHLILCCLILLLPSIFPASGSFPMSRLFASGSQSVGASASSSFLPMSIQDWLLLGLTGLIFLRQLVNVQY